MKRRYYYRLFLVICSFLLAQSIPCHAASTKIIQNDGPITKSSQKAPPARNNIINSPATTPVQQPQPLPARTVPQQQKTQPDKKSPVFKRQEPSKKVSIESVSVKDSRGRTMKVKGTISIEQGTTAILILTGKDLDIVNLSVPKGVTIAKDNRSSKKREVILKGKQAGKYQVRLRDRENKVLKVVSVQVTAPEKVYKTVKQPASPAPPVKPAGNKPAKPSPKPSAKVPAQPKKPSKMKEERLVVGPPNVGKTPHDGPAPPAPFTNIPAAGPQKKGATKAKSTVAKKPGKGSVAIDTVPLPEKPPVMKKPGTVAAKTTPVSGKATPAQVKRTKPKTIPFSKTKTAPKKPAGKTDQAGIIFVGKVSPKRSPAGKGSADTIVVTGKNLSGVTSARIVRKDRRAQPVRIITKKSGEISLEKPPSLQEGTYQIQLYAGSEPVQVAQHIARFQIRKPKLIAPLPPPPSQEPTSLPPKSGSTSSRASSDASDSQGEGSTATQSDTSGSAQTNADTLREQFNVPEGVVDQDAKPEDIASAIETIKQSGGDPSDPDWWNHFDSKVRAVETIQQSGGDASDPDWWNDFENKVREQFGIPHDVGGTGKDFSMTDNLNDLGTIQQLGREGSASSELWNDVASVREGNMTTGDFFSKWNVGGQGNTPGVEGAGNTHTGAGGSKVPGLSSGGNWTGNTGTNSSGTGGLGWDPGRDSGMDSGTSGGGSISGVDKPGRPSSGGPGSSDTNTNTGNTTPGGAGPSTDKGQSETGTALIFNSTTNEDGSYSYDWDAYDSNGNYLGSGHTECSGGTCTDSYSGGGSTTYADNSGTAPSDGVNNMEISTGGDDDSDSSGNDDDSGSNDDNDDNDSGEDDSNDDSENDDSGNDDSGNDDSSSDDTTMPADPDQYAGSNMTLEDLMRRNFTSDGTLIKVERLINPVPEDGSSSSGTGGTLSNPQSGVIDPPADTPQESGSPGNVADLKPINPVVDPPADTGQGTGTTGGTLKGGPDPVADTETDEGGEQNNGGSSTYSEVAVIPHGGSPSLGGGSMGPTEEWKCKRRLIISESGYCICYCPRDTHPVTGLSIQQSIPCPEQAQGTNSDQDQPQLTELLKPGQSEEMDCKEYTQHEWESMWPEYY